MNDFDPDDDGDDGDDEEGPDLTPEEEIAIAKRVFAKGELAHAVQHVAGALAHDPHNRSWLALLDRVLAAAKDPLEIVPLENGMSYALAAVRARLLAQRGEVDEALALLDAALEVKPDAGYFVWALEWLEPRGVVESTTPERLHVIFWRRMLEAARPDEMERALALVERATRKHKRNARLVQLRAGLLRRLGRAREALTVAKKALAIAPGFDAAVQVALAKRELGDVDGALAAYRNALRFDEDDVSARLEAGDMLLDHGRLEESAAWYQEALDRQPRHPWALPSIHCVRYLLDGKPKWRNALARIARRDPPNERARFLEARLTPYVGWLPDPRSPTIDLLRKLQSERRSSKKKPTLAITLSQLEAPSVRVVLRAAERRGAFRLDELEVSSVQQPDPRLVRGPVHILLWSWNGLEPVAEVKRPTRRVTALVSELASQPYDLGAWWPRARELAVAIGRRGLGSLLGVMVHPPLPGPREPDWTWMRKLQVASALVIAHLDAGWYGSLRRTVLVSLARGPVDWSVEAALVSLASVAREDPSARAEVLDVIVQLAERLPQGHCCYDHALFANALRLPDLPPETRKRFERELRRIERG